MIMTHEVAKTHCKDNVTPDQSLAQLHLGEELRVANNTSGISYLATCFIQSGDYANNRTFLHVREFRDLFEWL